MVVATGCDDGAGNGAVVGEGEGVGDEFGISAKEGAGSGDVGRVVFGGGGVGKATT